MRTVFWASRILREGGFVRRDSWCGDAYIYLCENEKVYMNWMGRRCKPVHFKWIFKDIEATNWEEATLSKPKEKVE